MTTSSARRRSRELTLQGLYQRQLSGNDAAEVRNVRTSMMTTGALLWQAALYNNGGTPYKNARYGESYAPDGTPQRLVAFPPPTPEDDRIPAAGAPPRCTPTASRCDRHPDMGAGGAAPRRRR